MEKLIATYLESRPELRRRFDLFPDNIRVSGGGLIYARFDLPVPLATLHPNRGRNWARGGRLFLFGVWALVTVAVTAALTFAFGGIGVVNQVWFLGVFGGLTGCGLALIAATLRPVEFALFHTDAGIIALTIGRVGPQVEEFEGFVSLLIEQIHAARAKVSPTLSPAPEATPGAFRLPPKPVDINAPHRGQAEFSLDLDLEAGRVERAGIDDSRSSTDARPDVSSTGGEPPKEADMMAHPLRPLLVVAARVFLAGNYRATLNLLEPVIEHDEHVNRPSPVSSLFWAVAGDCYFLLGEPERGFRAYRRSMELDGESACLREFACQVAAHRRVEDAEEALRALRNARAAEWHTFRKHPIHVLRHNLNRVMLSLRFVRVPIARWKLRRMVRAKG